MTKTKMNTRFLTVLVGIVLSIASATAQDDKLTHNAEYPYGEDSLYRFLSQNLHYPLEAIPLKLEGRVLVRFVVERDGSLDSIQVIQKVHPLLDDEAVRVIRLLPKWKPAMINGITVRSRFNFPINFRIPEEPESPTPSNVNRNLYLNRIPKLGTRR